MGHGTKEVWCVAFIQLLLEVEGRDAHTTVIRAVFALVCEGFFEHDRRLGKREQVLWAGCFCAQG